MFFFLYIYITCPCFVLFLNNRKKPTKSLKRIVCCVFHSHWEDINWFAQHIPAGDEKLINIIFPFFPRSLFL